MSSSSIRIISSSSTTRIRLAEVADCNCVADVILYPPMDTPVEADHALLRNRRWDVGRAAYHRSRPLAVRWFRHDGFSRGSLGLLPEPRQQAAKAKLRHREDPTDSLR